MEALSWGAAALEKALLGALVNLFTSGTAPSAFLARVLHLNVASRVGAFWAPTDSCLRPGKHGNRWIFGRRP